MRNPFRRGMASLVLAAVLFAPVLVLSEGDPTHGWKQSGVGFWENLPEIHAGYSDNGIAVELTLRPGDGAVWSRAGSWASDNALLQMSTDSIDPGENEYRAGQARFPASATFVYGKDSLSLGAKERIKLFIRQLRDGFRPSGIRLTYAWGTRLPAGSMYRLWEEETVFILAGPEEAGKRISTARSLAHDFQAAYARPPKGPVTKVLVEARRMPRGKGVAHTSITVRFPVD